MEAVAVARLKLSAVLRKRTSWCDDETLILLETVVVLALFARFDPVVVRGACFVGRGAKVPLPSRCVAIEHIRFENRVGATTSTSGGLQIVSGLHSLSEVADLLAETYWKEALHSVTGEQIRSLVGVGGVD